MNGMITVPRSPIFSVRLPPHQDGHAPVLCPVTALCHDIDAVHAVHAVAVVDLQAVVFGRPYSSSGNGSTLSTTGLMVPAVRAYGRHRTSSSSTGCHRARCR